MSLITSTTTRRPAIANGLTSSGDGVTTYCTSSLRLTDSHGSSTLTPFDLIVIVDLQYPNLGSWHEAHAVEVKPYGSVTRVALFKAADQAALRRCTFSWLLRSDEPNPAAPCPVHEMLDDPLIRKPHLRGFQHGFGPHCTSFPPGSTPSVSDDASCTDFPTVPVAIQELRNRWTLKEGTRRHHLVPARTRVYRPTLSDCYTVRVINPWVR